MRCVKCTNEMIQLDINHWRCNHCDSVCIKHDNLSVELAQQKYIKQNSRIGEDGIYVPVHDMVPEGQESSYRLVMTKEMFIEAYNKWIKGTDIE